MQNKIKVLFLLPDGLGGAEHQAVNIAGFLPKHRFSVSFVVVGKACEHAFRIIPDSYEKIHLKCRGIWDFGTLRIWRLFKHCKPDAVFSTFHYLNGRVILAARIIGGIRTIIRGNGYLWDGDILGRIIDKIYYRYADAIICQTPELLQQMKDEIHGLGENLYCISNPIDKKRIEILSSAPNPYPNHGGIYVNIGRISEIKDQMTLLKAFSLIDPSSNDYHLYLVGDFELERSYYDSLLQYVKDSGIETYVHFVGFVSNPFPYMKYADCFVLSSIQEGLPNSLIEAQYLRVPSVSTLSCQSVTSIVSESLSGFVVPVGDFEAMAVAMKNALSLNDIPYLYQESSSDAFVSLFEI